MLGRNLHPEGVEVLALLPRAVGAPSLEVPSATHTSKSEGQLPSRHCRGSRACIPLCSGISPSLHPITTLRAAGCSVPAWHSSGASE